MATKLLNMDCMEYMAGVPDGYFDLIICDPPYFEVKGDFDFAWNSFSDYLNDVERWAAQLARVLADNGSLYWYGHAKKIAYQQVIFDKYLNLENSLVWWKLDAQTNKGVDGFRVFPPVTERCLFYSKEINMTGLESIKLDVNNFKSLRHYFKELHSFLNASKKEIVEKIGGRADHPFRHSSSQWELPTPETYNQIREAFQADKWEGWREYEDLRREYEDLRREYEDLRRPFNNKFRLTDVMRFSQEAHITGKYRHETQKPPKLTKALIQTVTRQNSRAFVPFMGSGTEVIECINLGIDVVACEVSPNHFAEAERKIKRETAQIDMFAGAA